MHGNRSMKAGAGALVLVLALAGAAFADDAPTTAPAHPDLSGHWVLNEKASEMPHFGGGHDGPGGGHGGPGGGRHGNRGGGDGSRPEVRSSMMLPNDMVVELYDDTLMVSERGLAVRKLAFGGGKDALKAASGAQAGGPEVIAAHWDKSRVVSQVPGRRGGTVSETWELSKDGQQLVVKTELPAMGDRPGVEIKRVYDRAE